MSVWHTYPMPQNLSNYDAALKDNYGPGLKNAVNNSNVVFTEVGKNTEDIIGRKAVWSIHSGRSASSGNRAEGAVLPVADRERYIAPEDTLAYTYHTIKVSGQAKELTRGTTGAFAKALESEIDGAEKALKNDQNRQAFGQKLTDGTNLQSGVIVVLSADPGTGTTLTAATATGPEIRTFFKGETIVFIDPATGNQRAGSYRTVVSADKTAKTITISSACDAAVASGDYVVRGDASDNNFGDEINGLRHLISSTQTYAGINPSTEPVWAAQAVGSSTTAISETLLEEASEAVEMDGDGSTPNLFIFANTQRRKLAAQLQTQKRWDGMQTTLKAGWRGLDIAMGTLVVDRYCPENDGFGLTTSEIERFIGLDFTWDDTGGSVLYKALDDTDAVQARFKAYHNLEAVNRNSHVRITVSTPVF